MNTPLINEYELRHNCDMLSNLLMGLVEGLNYPDDVQEALQNLLELSGSYLIDGYTYHIIYDEKGNMDFIYTAPTND